MDWSKKIWLLAIGAIFTVFVAFSWNKYLAIALIVLYLIMFPLTIRKQFFSKNS